MNVRKSVSAFLTITCTSFTVIMLLYCVLWSKGGIAPKTVFGLFGVCFAVGAVVLLTSFLPLQGDVLKMAIYFIETFAVVFFFGGVILRLFPFSLKILLAVLGMLAAAYAVVMAAIMANEKICSDEINKKLAEMKKQK